MKRIICIAGDAASGKTTAARKLQERLPGWTIVSTGARFREFCARHSLDPQQIAHLPDELHRQADDEMRRTLASAQRVIAEGRLVGYLARDLPDVLRVFCDAPLEVRAARLIEREPAYTLEQARARVAERDRQDTEKFRRLYGVDYHDPSFYDLVLDTARLDPDRVADAILERAADP